MRAPPEAVRAQIQQLLVDRMVRTSCISVFQQLVGNSMSQVRRMGEEERETVMSFVDRAEEKGAQKTPWGVFLTNALPLGETLSASLRSKSQPKGPFLHTSLYIFLGALIEKNISS